MTPVVVSLKSRSKPSSHSHWDDIAPRTSCKTNSNEPPNTCPMYHQTWSSRHARSTRISHKHAGANGYLLTPHEFRKRPVDTTDTSNAMLNESLPIVIITNIMTMWMLILVEWLITSVTNLARNKPETIPVQF